MRRAVVTLGLNAYHADASACLLRDGTLVAAAEEERFRRIKHWAGFPSESIRYCLREAKVRLADITHVALNQDTRANLWRKVGYTLMRRPDLPLVLYRLGNRKGRARVDEELESLYTGERFKGEVIHIEHHLAHLGSAFLVSPFERAVAVSVDGFGDFASAAWGTGAGSKVEVDERIYFPHSLGLFYQAMTQLLGFPHYGDEYKVMGLAPYGEPKRLAEMRRIVKLKDDGAFELDLEFFIHHRGKISYQWGGGTPTFVNLFSPALEALLGPARRPDEPLTQAHRDLARSVQAMYEEAFFHLLNRLHERYRLDDLALAGGCAMNSVANGKVYRNTPFKRLYVQSAAGDAGGAIGAAFVAWHRVNGGANRAAQRFEMSHAYWGPEFENGAISDLLGTRGGDLKAQGCSVTRAAGEEDLCTLTAQAIADGLVVGWFQGRMEWGPRALGNRSIVCDPRRADMKEILNAKIKRRESFRPFAPSVLREAVPEWFETDDEVPFMMQVYPIRAEKRAAIPAVTHVDGSGRLQTVRREDNPRYYRLIEAFRDLTGIPMVLNTSFNENEPVVCRPEEALECFLRTRMDLLVMGEWIVRRGP